MELLLRPTASPSPMRTLPRLFHPSKKKKITRAFFSANLQKEDDDHHFKAAMNRASLRYQETLRTDAVITDPYIRCLLLPGIQVDSSRLLHEHCLATKFIDDKLISTMQKVDGLRQVVLLTDGMDSRPYRLKWPASTLLFDVSPDRIFRMSIQKLEDIGAKITSSCLFLHVPSETSDIEQALRTKGFNGTRPSLWVLQGLPMTTLAKFKDILGFVRNLATKGSLFIGELPDWLVETEMGIIKSTKSEWMDKRFMSHGLTVEMIGFDEVSRNVGRDLAATNDHKSILFVAEQLQFSDDQMEIWRTEFRRLEEEGDEEGFEEL